MKQLKSSREYWPKRHHKLTKKICLQVEGKGKVCQFIPILVKFTFLSNSWLNKLQNMPCRIFYPWTCDWNLIFALSDTELEIFWQLLFFVLMFISFLSLIADIFFRTLEFPFLQFQIVTVAPIWIRGTLDRGQRITIAHWGEEGAKWWSYKKCRNTVGKCEYLREKKTFSLSLGLRFC